MNELEIIQKIVSAAGKLLSAYPCRVGEEKFDTLDCRWILLDPLAFMGLIVGVKMYEQTEGRLDDNIIYESIRVGLAAYMSGGKNIVNMEQSKGRIMKIMNLTELTFEDEKKISDDDSFLLKCLSNLENVDDGESRIIVP